MNNNEFENAFKELNKRLVELESALTVICVGGYALSQYDVRTTKDVDGFFWSTYAIDEAIYEVGEMFHLNDEERWLNNSVANLNRAPSEDICTPIYEFSNLRVLMPPLEYIAGMKLRSARDKDISDVASIIKILKDEDPRAFAEKLETEYGFVTLDFSNLLDAYAEAYGFDWLAEFYKKNTDLFF